MRLFALDNVEQAHACGMAQTRRVFKVAEKIREILSRQLLLISDPRFSMITITSVMVSPDLRFAKIYWAVPPIPGRLEEARDALEDRCSQFRRSLAEDLGARVVPEIRFYYDETMDKVLEVDRLFERIKREDEARAEKKASHDK